MPSTAQTGQPVPFDAHIELHRLFLARRDEVVDKIQGLLNARKEPAQYLQDIPRLSRHFRDCFFTLTGITHEQPGLRDQLEDAHHASGFRPRRSPGLHNDLVDPAEMMARAFHLWQQTHWPGSSGRLRYAHTLFNLYLIRRLALLTMRLWDGGSNHAGDRLLQIQSVLDDLWKTTPVDHPVLVRDARWLIPLAQSPTTDELRGYFEVAERVADDPSEEDRDEIHRAGVVTGGGHLRSQLRHVTTQKCVSLDTPSLILSTRRSNALDLALLIEGLVPLLAAYEQAMQQGDVPKRLELADIILQGVSADPELFLNRLDLLGPYSMIEHLFMTTSRNSDVVYTAMGLRHVRLVREYTDRIRRLTKALDEDRHHFRPLKGKYSPYGVIYGFSSNLLEHMALKALERDAETAFSLEDVFTSGNADKLAWVDGWRKLPHIKPEVAKLFEYPQEFAEDIFARIEGALQRSVPGDEARPAMPSGRLFILSEDDLGADSQWSAIPDLPVKYILSSDPQLVAAHKAVPFDSTHLIDARLEGEFVISYETPGGWVAIPKDILTEVLGAGDSVKIVGLPSVAAGVLRLMCPDLVVVPGN